MDPIPAGPLVPHRKRWAASWPRRGAEAVRASPYRRRVACAERTHRG